MTETQGTDKPARFALFPLGDKILVKVDTPPERTAGGLYVPDSAQKPKEEGIVAAVGEGRFVQITGMFIPPSVEVGERVIFAKFAGDSLERDGVQYRILKESELLAVYRIQPK